jgi:hypothetical protein
MVSAPDTDTVGIVTNARLVKHLSNHAVVHIHRVAPAPHAHAASATGTLGRATGPRADANRCIARKST